MQQRILTDNDDPRLATLPAFPTMYDLPSEDPEEPGLPDDYHDLQPQLLSRTLQLSGYSKDAIYTASDLNLYYDLSHPLWHKRPDWFLVVGVPRLYPQGDGDRESYVIWQEKVSPIVVVEFLSPGTEIDDLGRFFRRSPKPQPPGSPPSKFIVYEQILKVPHYIVYNKRDRQLRYFQLVNGSYQEQSVAATNPRIWLNDLDVGLAIWQGKFEGLPKDWLRWCDRLGEVLLTDTEAALQREAIAQQQQQQAEADLQQAEAERQQAEADLQQAEADLQQAEAERQQVALKLRQTVLRLHGMGMEIAQIAEITGLTVSEVEAIVEAL
jgi:Uma2 family endonuclease